MNLQTSSDIDRKEQRKNRVLGHIVHSYISTAGPISSKIVAEIMDLSSATVRNIMAELEDEGYIEQPYTSAGRVPTNTGYRQYVDMVKSHIKAEQEESERLAREYTRKIETIKEIMTKTSFLIIRELQSAGVVLWPGIENFHLKHIELVKVKPRSILAIIVMMSNDVKNYIIELDKDVSKIELIRVSNYINENYSELSLPRVLAGLRDTVRDMSFYEHNNEFLQSVQNALLVLDSVVEEYDENELYWEGLNYFMDAVNSDNIDVTRNLYQMFSEREGLVKFLRGELPYSGIKVYIGTENKQERLNNCSVITCGYSLRNKTVGRIGVIGPTRMDYGHAMRVVSCLGDLISLKLEEIN
ncbi:MAG: heat-inducible transcriptional repressor HrcA [Candidatus Omnitrophica bacterium]|nr:heat-inducible transcriptional repressor HrcA [Candidatus Omnitrophota bacterium]MBU1894281.1 heat-inducible transcriptional repressor HrcA [Candidatus Omnitrophota bacterium]